MDKLPFLMEMLNPTEIKVTQADIPWDKYEKRYREYTGKYAFQAPGPSAGKTSAHAKRRRTE